MCVEHLGGTLEINDQNPSVTHFLSVLMRTFVSLSEKLTNLHFHRNFAQNNLERNIRQLSRHNSASVASLPALQRKCSTCWRFLPVFD